MSDKVKVSVTSVEKINLELINPKLKYSNATIGSTIETYTDDTADDRKDALNQLTAELSEYMEEERNQLIEDLKSQ